MSSLAAEKHELVAVANFVLVAELEYFGVEEVVALDYVAAEIVEIAVAGRLVVVMGEHYKVHVVVEDNQLGYGHVAVNIVAAAPVAAVLVVVAPIVKGWGSSFVDVAMEWHGSVVYVVVGCMAFYVYWVVMLVVVDIDPIVVEKAVLQVVVDDEDNAVEFVDVVDDAVDGDLMNIAVEHFVEVFVVIEYDDLVVALILDVDVESVAVNEEAGYLVANDDVAAVVLAQYLRVSVGDVFHEVDD